MSSIKNIVLYNYYYSSCSWRVRAVMTHKNISYKYESVDLLDGKQHTDEFLKLNPMHQIPAFKFTNSMTNEDNLITQSLAIIEFIEEMFPERPIFPKDAVMRAKSRAIAETISGGIQPLQNLETLKEYNIPLGGQITTAEEKQKVARYWIDKKLAHLETLVKQSAGKYCVGDEVSVADVCLVPQMFNARRFGFETTKYPILHAIDTRLNELDIFKRTHPHVCPDFPPERLPQTPEK